MNGSEKMKLVKGIYRDVKAIELNDLLTKFMGKLEETCISYEEELMNITLIEVERREKDFDELIQNPEDFHKVIDLIDKKTNLEEILIELKDIVYVGYEETEIAESSSFLTSKTSPRFRKQSECADWLVKHVKPHILNGECRRNYIAEREGVAPQTITNRMKQVFGQETNWGTYVLKVQNGDY